jgi:uncharacterized membrane protein
MSPTFDEDTQTRESERVVAARILGRHLVVAAAIVGISAVVVAMVMNSQRYASVNWYVVFVAVFVAAYVAYQRYLR